MYNAYIIDEPENIFRLPTSVLESCARDQVRWVGERPSLRRARVYWREGGWARAGGNEKRPVEMSPSVAQT